ncbi:MAG: TolC family protein [Acidobacteria bacterium]|nr:TolC family protein [Acidobacteriota bacterium]
MRRARTILLLSLWAACLSAETTLTLDKILALADDNHPRLRAGSAQIDSARAGVVGALAYPNPEFGARIGGQDYRVPGNVRGLVSSLVFSQPLELGQGQQSSELALAAVRLAVLAEVRRAFFQALRKRSEISILSENVRLVEDFRRRLQVRVDVGEAGRLELYRADAELAVARTAASSARLQYVAALAGLRAAVGAPLEADLVLEGALDTNAHLPSADEVREVMLQRHPMLAWAQAEIRVSEARVRYETALRRPQPSLIAEMDRPPDTPTYRVGMSIPLSLWNKREGPIAAAAADLRRAQALADNGKLELLARLAGAYERYQLAGEQLRALEQGLIREAEAGLQAAETAYRLGERGILEVLDAQRVLRTVRLDLLNTQFDRQAALVEVDELRALELRRKEP